MDAIDLDYSKVLIVGVNDVMTSCRVLNDLCSSKEKNSITCGIKQGKG